MIDYDTRAYLEGGTYYCPQTLFSPQEIEEAGFVFVPVLTFVHQHDNPQNPIMQSYIGYGNSLEPKDPNLHPMVMRTHRWCGAGYEKDYDPADSPRWRGIEGVYDYFGKKDIFKPQIIKWMKELGIHYIHKVLLEDSPGIYEEKGLSEKFGHPVYRYRYAVHVRGAKIPKIVEI